MTFNKTYAIVVRLKKGIEIVRQKKTGPEHGELKRDKKTAVGFSNDIFCSNESNKDFKVNQIYGQHRSFEYHPRLSPHLAFLKV